jgi:hypothetical protein
MQCIAFDARKRCTWAFVKDETGKIVREERVAHINRLLIEVRGVLLCVGP